MNDSNNSLFSHQTNGNYVTWRDAAADAEHKTQDFLGKDKIWGRPWPTPWGRPWCGGGQFSKKEKKRKFQ